MPLLGLRLSHPLPASLLGSCARRPETSSCAWSPSSRVSSVRLPSSAARLLFLLSARMKFSLRRPPARKDLLWSHARIPARRAPQLTSPARSLFLCSVVHGKSSLLPITPSHRCSPSRRRFRLSPFAFVDAPWLDSAQFASCSSLHRACSVPLFLRVLSRSFLFSSPSSRVVRAKLLAVDIESVTRALDTVK